MNKLLFIAGCLFLVGCSSSPESKSEDDEWIQPRECTALALQNPRCDLDPDCERNKPEEIENTNLILEDHECVMRKTACIDDNVKDEDIKCTRELD